MASGSLLSRLRSLIQLTAKAQKAIQDTCGEDDDLVLKARKLYWILRRVEREATKNGGPLSRDEDSHSKALARIVDKCINFLNRSESFITHYNALRSQEEIVLGPEGLMSFNDRYADIVQKFRSDFQSFTIQCSKSTVEASLETIGKLREDMYDAGYTLASAVKLVTARLLANNDKSITRPSESSNGDIDLWEKLHYELLNEKISHKDLVQHKDKILQYVKAIERESALEDKLGASVTEGPTPSPSSATKTKGSDDTKPARSTRYSSSTFTRNEGGSRTTPSKKRRRQNDDEPGETPSLDESAAGPSSTGKEEKPGFKPSDPLKVFEGFVQQEVFESHDNDTLMEFLNEEPMDLAEGLDGSLRPLLRDQVREIYRSLHNGYEVDCRILLSQSSTHNAKDINNYKALIDMIEKHVLDKLDEFQLGKDEELRSIRKKIIERVHRLLKDLDAAKDRIGGA